MPARLPCLLAVATGALLAAPGRADDRLYGIDEKVEGKTHAEWSVAFFQWALAIPKDRNPITDPTGKFAGEGQKDAVWFLAGNLGGVTRRKVTVPAGKPVFSPLIYILPNAPAEKADVKTLTDGTQAVLDRVKGLDVTLDGTSLGDLSKHRAVSDGFTFTGPPEEKAVHRLFAGKRTAVAAGYWFILKPLPAGDHTLRIKGRLEGATPESTFELNITYELKVVKDK